MSEYDAVVFDSDGILVAPPRHDAQVAAARAAFDDLGIEDVDREALAGLVTDPSADRIGDLAATHDVDPEAVWNARERHDERFQERAFEDGSRTTYDDVSAIADIAGTRGVVSNNHHATIEFVLDFFDLEHLFETYYGRENGIGNLARRKPNPHYIERALADLDAADDRVLYVGDSESDVVAADRAAVDSAFVRRPHREGLDLSVSPTYEVADLHAVRRIANGS
ncbi:HAD family hydrolase [Halococcus hamelinensis]|uniref:HAD-superfamily hydrolase n=1 Tax=Halococcus hamelinensis 100A6 TaxID=1132509 RepID=M0M5L2_9EURY|nr:HAD-IA family hydrolase [Halococcus hamelinensis]EMA41087.1 HAD-superfamily hydrolase [Halococcus hamelinensis 100A6]